MRSVREAAVGGADRGWRDRHLRHTAAHGRTAWQKASGYTRRARAEAAIGRWKQVIGGGLRAHTDERRATEVEVAVHTLNRMLGWDARTMCASSDPNRGRGDCADSPDLCTTLSCAASRAINQCVPKLGGARPHRRAPWVSN